MGKKILHIPNFYPPQIGGIEDVCYSIITATTKQGFEHQVMCFHNQKKTCIEEHEGVKVVRSGVVRKLFSQAISYTYRKELKTLFREFKPDIVHFHTPNPLASVYLLTTIPSKTKLILHWHSDVVAQKFLYLFYRPIEWLLLRRASKILVTSPTYIAGSAALLRQKKNRILVIPNTINRKKLQLQEGEPEEVDRMKALYSKGGLIFTFGRHVSYKGLEYLINSLKLTQSKANVIIAGNGPLSGHLKKQAEKMNIQFTGHLSESQLRCHLYAADIFAFPSITRNEAFGIALAEAMYCGLPPVTFTIKDSGVNWVSVANETGLEVKNSDSKAFAEAIDRLLDDESLRNKLGQKAKERVETLFVPEAIKDKIIYLYNELT